MTTHWARSLRWRAIKCSSSSAIILSALGRWSHLSGARRGSPGAPGTDSARAYGSCGRARGGHSQGRLTRSADCGTAFTRTADPVRCCACGSIVNVSGVGWRRRDRSARWTRLVGTAARDSAKRSRADARAVGRSSRPGGWSACSDAEKNSGEPDGYSGLARRGSYERLVAAEWGVAELFPDEFLRRAAAGEHLFLDLARREPHGALRSIAIVSAGPAQLGAPRLAHVASLIVLARRAEAAGVGFCWGVLEDREHRLIDGLDEAGIQRLLGARTAVAADSDAFDRWTDAIGRQPTEDFWFIGADEDAPSAAQAGASPIIVRDLLVPNTRALEVEIERRGPPARLRLDLPAPDQCVRLFPGSVRSWRLAESCSSASARTRRALRAGRAQVDRSSERRLVRDVADSIIASRQARQPAKMGAATQSCCRRDRSRPPLRAGCNSHSRRSNGPRASLQQQSLHPRDAAEGGRSGTIRTAG